MTATPRPRFPWPFPEPLGTQPADESSTQWRDSVISDKAQWQATFDDLFNGAGSAMYLARATRLAGYGFSPQDLRQACANPRFVAAMPDSEQRSEVDVEAFAALAHEAALYYSTGYGMAREAELGYARRLIALGWLQPQAASLLGVSKQRVSRLLKQKRTTFGPFPGLSKTARADQEPQVQGDERVTVDGRTVGELNKRRSELRWQEKEKHQSREGGLGV